MGKENQSFRNKLKNVSKIKQSPNHIKSNYDKGLWDASMLRVCVKKGMLDVDTFKDITDIDY